MPPTKNVTVLAVIERSLAVPQKRHDKAVLGFLTRPEMEAIIAAPDCATWAGRRDHALFTFLYNTGARISEAITPRRRRGAGCLASRTPPRQGEKATKRLTLEGDGRYTPTVAPPSARRWPTGVSVPEQRRRQAIAVQRGSAARTGSRAGSAQDSSADWTGNLAAHDPPHDGDAPAAVGRGYHRHRAVARS
jgi:hypothetical protein